MLAALAMFVLAPFALAADAPPWDPESPDFDANHPQIAVLVRMTDTVPKDGVTRLGLEWQKAAVASDRRAPEPPVPYGYQQTNVAAWPKEDGLTAFSATGHEYLTAVAGVFSEDDAKRALKAVEAELRVAPKVTLFQGATAVVRDAVERPFVVGGRRFGNGFEPKIETLEEGWRAAIRTHPDDDRLIAVRVCEQSVTGAGVVNLPAGFPMTLQSPRTRGFSVDANGRLAEDECLLIGLATEDGWRYVCVTTRTIRLSE